MGVYGDSISDTVPSVGDPETTASASVSALLTEFKTRLTAKVTPASFNINDDIDMNSNALSELAYAAFITQVGNPATNETLFTKLVGSIDELHYKDSSGQVTQVTDDGALNVAATGAITGAGYGSGGVAVNWNSAGSNYQMKSGSGSDDYASVTMDECQLRDGSSHSVNLKSPSLSASYDVTFPAALPSVAKSLSMDASGVVAAGGAVENVIQGVGWFQDDGSGASTVSFQGYIQLTSSSIVRLPITGLRPGDTINSIAVEYLSSLSGGTPSARIEEWDGTSSTSDSDTGFTSDSTQRNNEWSTSNITTAADGKRYYLVVDASAASSGNFRLYGFSVNVTRA